MTNQNKISNKIQIAVLALFIVFMPLGSWYYLQSGFDYHEKLMSELKDYGELEQFDLVTQDADTLRKLDLQGKIMIANFFTEGTPSANTAMDYSRRILGQFKSQKDLIFLFHSMNSVDAAKLKSIAEKEELIDKRAYFLSGDEKIMSNLLVEGYRVPMLENRTKRDSITFKNDLSSLPKDYPYFVLIDESLKIRNYYDINDKASMNSLVEHLAIILPREKKSKAELRPKKEK